MHRFKSKGLQDQQIQCALKQIRRRGHMRSPRYPTTASHPTCRLSRGALHPGEDWIGGRGGNGTHTPRLRRPIRTFSPSDAKPQTDSHPGADEKSSADKVMRMPLSKQRKKHIQRVLVEAAKLAPRLPPELAM